MTGQELRGTGARCSSCSHVVAAVAALALAASNSGGALAHGWPPLVPAVVLWLAAAAEEAASLVALLLPSPAPAWARQRGARSVGQPRAAAWVSPGQQNGNRACMPVSTCSHSTVKHSTLQQGKSCAAGQHTHPPVVIVAPCR